MSGIVYGPQRSVRSITDEVCATPFPNGDPLGGCGRSPEAIAA
jgi:hypothetical protein